MNNNSGMYYSPQEQAQEDRDKALVVTLFLAFGLVAGVVLALISRPKPKPDPRKDFAGWVEYNLHHGQKATNQAINRLEKELGELRKSLEDRVKELR